MYVARRGVREWDSAIRPRARTWMDRCGFCRHWPLPTQERQWVHYHVQLDATSCSWATLFWATAAIFCGLENTAITILSTGAYRVWRELLAFGWLAWHTAACSRHAMYSEVYSMYMCVMRQSAELDGALHRRSLRSYRSGKVFRKEKLTRKLVSVDEIDGKRRWRSNLRSKWRQSHAGFGDWAYCDCSVGEFWPLNLGGGFSLPEWRSNDYPNIESSSFGC